MEARLKKRSESIRVLFQEYGAAYDIILNLIYYLQLDIRHAVLEGVPDSLVKKHISDNIDKFPNYQDEYRKAFTKALIEGGGSQNSER